MNTDGPGSETDISQIQQALFQLYHDNDPVKKLTADRWLQQVQQTPQAWEIAWTLLAHQGFEVQNFGALILTSKVTRQWEELSQDQYPTFQQELFKTIARFSIGPKVVLIQLCRALVGVAFHTLPELWPNTVISCVQSLRSATQLVSGPTDYTNALLQLLTILPEEFERSEDRMTAQRRGVVRREICEGLPSVLVLLEEVLTQSQEVSTKIAAMNCISSWAVFGVSLPEVDSLLHTLFTALSLPGLLETACLTIREIITQESSYKYPTALCQCLQRVLQLRDFVSIKVEQSDIDVCMCLAQLITDIANSNMDLLMNVTEDDEMTSDLCTGTVQLLLEFTCVPGNYPVDEVCSEVALAFWSRFTDGIANMDPERSRHLTQYYSSTLFTLIEVLPDKAQYPPDEDWTNEWTDDDRDNFVKYREDLCDVGECLQRIMHMEYIQHLSNLLSSLVASSTPPSWQGVEAILYLLQGVSSHLHQHSSPHLHTVLSLFPRLPAHPTLAKAALSLLGCLSNWFKDHVDLLHAVLPMILDMLSEPSLTTSAALAFRDMCGDCSSELVPLVTRIVPPCQVVLSDPGQECQTCVRVVCAVGCVLSSMSVKDLLEPLQSLVECRVRSLQELASAEPDLSIKDRVWTGVEILSAVCHHIYPTLGHGEQHPVVMLLIQLFPALQALVSKWCSDQGILESICICLNRGIRTVGDQYAPLLNDTVELVTQCYVTVQHSKLLCTATQIVEVFGKESSCGQLLTKLVTQLHTTSLQVFQSDIRENPDLVQSYLALVTTVIKTCPHLFIDSEGVADNIFEIGLASLQLPEQPTVTATSSFFVVFISLFPSNKAVNATLTHHGHSLSQHILQAIAWAAPRSYLRLFASVLVAMAINCSTLLSQWLEELFSRQDGFPSTHLTPEEKAQFKSTLLRERNARVVRERVAEFSLMCRGYHGTLYAAETTNQ